MFEILMRAPLFKRVLSLLILGCAGVGPLVFPLAAWFGYSDACWYCNLRSLAVVVLLPSAGLLAVAILAALACGAPEIARRSLAGLTWGLVATLALEAIRIGGFRMGWMPGDLPRFMGVQLLGQFAEGPSLPSDLAGWAYHFWNGGCFGIIFALLVGRSTGWKGAAYGAAIGLGFMASPVVVGLGIGRFGVDFGPSFAFTVTAAHLAFGAALGYGLGRWPVGELSGTQHGWAEHPTKGARLPWICPKSSSGCATAESSNC